MPTSSTATSPVHPPCTKRPVICGWIGTRTGDVSSISSEAPSILHVANSGTASWYDIAHRVFDAAEALGSLTPCTTLEYPTPARRPAWSVLDTTVVEQLLGSPLPSWEQAIDRFLQQLKSGI